MLSAKGPEEGEKVRLYLAAEKKEKILSSL